MERIETNNHTEFENSVIEQHENRKKLVTSFFNVAGLMLGAFIALVVIASVTTDVNLRDFKDFAGFMLDFFLLLFCSYSMYVTSSDSGMRAGLHSEEYKESVKAYDVLKKKIIDEKRQGKLGEFCRYFTENEIKEARTSVLATAGIAYEQFEAEWLGKDPKMINALDNISMAQKKAIVCANAIHPVKLTPEMIMKRGRGSARRAPLGITPWAKKGINFGVKFVTTVVTVLGLSMIVLEPISDPTWKIFAQCCVKLVAVVVNGFSGYKFGYENIVFDTVDYIHDQGDLMRRAIDWMDETAEGEEQI